MPVDIDHARFLERLQELQGAMTDAQFSRRVGTPPSTIKQWQKGSWPSLAAASRIAETFNVSIDWISGRAGAAKQTSAINAKYLQEAIAVVDQWLSDTDREMPVDKKASLVTQIYEFIVDDASQGRADVDSTRIQKLLRLVA